MKRIVVAVDTVERERVAEALRAAIGLGLRGDAIEVVFRGVGPARLAAGNPDIARAVATLELLGHRMSDAGELERAVAEADIVEVWT